MFVGVYTGACISSSLRDELLFNKIIASLFVDLTIIKMI